MDLLTLSVRELLVELARVEDRLREEVTSSGGRPLPGQIRRQGALRRTARLISAELSRRRENLETSDPHA